MKEDSGNATQPSAGNEAAVVKYDGPKHTPRPWRAIHEPAHNVGDCIDNGGYRIDAEGVEQLAFVWTLNHRYLGNGIPQSQGPAFGAVQAGYNARLIAAAPDLAFAAMEAWQAISWVMTHDNEDGYLKATREHLEAALNKSGHYDFAAMRAGLESIRAAIAKAEAKS